MYQSAGGLRKTTLDILNNPNQVTLDIETTGLDRDGDDITIVTLYTETATRKQGAIYVNTQRGDELEALAPLAEGAELYGYDRIVVKPFDEFIAWALSERIVVTYNGERFDLPFIRSFIRRYRRRQSAQQLSLFGEEMTGASAEIPPVDLSHWCHSDLYRDMAMQMKPYLNVPNLRLKTLLSCLQIPRHPLVEDSHGDDAVVLWSRWLASGDPAYLQKLSLYGLEDVRCTHALSQKLLAMLHR